MNEILKVEQLKKVYGNKGNITHALNGISFKVEKGEFLGVMGASGSGKSTLLNCISTIDTATSGHILIEKSDVTQLKNKELSKFRREKLGFIFQDFNLLDTLTGYENIALALSINYKKVSEIENKVKAIGQTLGILDILNKYPYQMSGGQQQRVAAARAMVTKPALILADEPTGALDSKSSKILLENMLELNQKLEATILMVTHDAVVASYCSRIIFIKDGLIFNEIRKGNDSRKKFFDEIMEVQGLLGGEQSYEF